jgi:hypothetical protein
VRNAFFMEPAILFHHSGVSVENQEDLLRKPTAY